MEPLKCLKFPPLTITTSVTMYFVPYRSPYIHVTQSCFNGMCSSDGSASVTNVCSAVISTVIDGYKLSPVSSCTSHTLQIPQISENLRCPGSGSADK